MTRDDRSEILKQGQNNGSRIFHPITSHTVIGAQMLPSSGMYELRKLFYLGDCWFLERLIVDLPWLDRGSSSPWPWPCHTGCDRLRSVSYRPYCIWRCDVNERLPFQGSHEIQSITLLR